MSVAAPFKMQGLTLPILATTQAPGPGVQVKSIDNIGANNYVLTNFGPDIAFVGYGPDAQTAANNATIPQPGSGAFCIIMLPGQQSFSLPPNAFFAAICPTSNATVYVTPGDGTARGGQLPNIGFTQAAAQVNQLLTQIAELLVLIAIEAQIQTEQQMTAFQSLDDIAILRADRGRPSLPTSDG